MCTFLFSVKAKVIKVLSMMKVVLPEIIFSLPAFDLEFFEGYTGSLCASSNSRFLFELTWTFCFGTRFQWYQKVFLHH